MARRGGEGERIRKALAITELDKIQRGIEYRKRIQSVKLVLILILIASAAVFAAIAAFAIWNEGISTFVNAIGSMNLWYFGAALAIIFIGYAMRFPKWEYYLRRLRVSVPRRKNFVIYMSMYSMDITPGRWGRAVVSYTINRLTKVSFARTFPAIVADIFTDFLGFAIVLVVATILVQKFVLVSGIITVLLLIPFIFVYIKQPFDFIKRKFSWIRQLKYIFLVGTLYFKYHRLLTKKAYVYSMVYTIPAQFLNGLALYFVMLAFGVNLPLAAIPTVLFIFSSSLILGMVTGIPATLGVTDAAMIGYLILFFPTAISLGLASLITIFFRIASVWFVEGFGLTSLLYTMRYWDDK